MCLAAALLTLVVAAVYGILASVWQLHAMGIVGFLPSVNAWEAAGLLGVAVALFNVTGDSVEVDCDQGLEGHSAVTYGLAFATTILVALVLERASHGTWLAAYFRSWLGATVVGAFLVTKLVAMRWHRRSLLSSESVSLTD